MVYGVSKGYLGLYGVIQGYIYIYIYGLWGYIGLHISWGLMLWG